MVIPQNCIEHPHCARLLHWRALTSASIYTSSRDFLPAELDNEINARFLLTERSDLYFLLHNFGLQIKKQNLCSYLKASTKPLLENDNYDLENKESTNVLSRYSLKLCDSSPPPPPPINYITHCSTLLQQTMLQASAQCKMSR